MKQTEHYFFDWPKLESFLQSYVKDRQANWRPWVANESLRWLENGLKGRPVTRDIDWGIEIPADRIPADKLLAGHEHKRLYVWFEAVIGYLSASIKQSEEGGQDWKAYWHNDEAKHYYFAGKDNLVFHSLFWPGQLHAYDEKLHLPDVPAINQFLTLNNEAFSKSFGVTLDPKKILADFDLDIVRLYLCLIMPENSDSDFTWSDFIVKTNNLIIANLGNFIFRTLKLSESLNISDCNNIIIDLVEKHLAKAKAAIEQCRFRDYAEIMLELSAEGNKYLSEQTPWKIKDDETKKADILSNALLITLALSVLLKPITPASADKLNAMLGIEINNWLDAKDLASLVKSIKISNPEPLFKKIEADPEADGFNEKYK